MKWEARHYKVVRESLCQQFFLSDDSDLHFKSHFLKKWKHLCLEMSRESLCSQQFLEEYGCSETFHRSWTKLCRDIVRESICVQRFVQSDETSDYCDNPGFVDVLSYFDDMLFHDWIHERGLSVVVVPPKKIGVYCSCENVSF